jgi:predicted RNase H-like HicB family nuclease
MGLSYKIEVIKNEEGEGYTLYCPELHGCITSADTIEEGVVMIEDAKKCWFEACIEDNIQIPLPGNLESYSGQFKLRIPKSLHKILAEKSRSEGISMNQYCLFLLSRAAK